MYSVVLSLLVQLQWYALLDVGSMYEEDIPATCNDQTNENDFNSPPRSGLFVVRVNTG